LELQKLFSGYKGMSAGTVLKEEQGLHLESGKRMRPSFRISDLWKAPLHDLQIRDEILFQYFPLESNTRLLEIGVGSGFTPFRLARQIRSITGVDVAAGNVASLVRTVTGRPNLNFVVADVCKPGLRDAVKSEFDTAIGIEIFEFLPDTAMCLKNVASVLRKGGSLMLNFANYPPPKNAGVSHFNNRRELLQIFEDAGFTDVDIYALRLRPWAQFVYDTCHEKPIRLYRRLRDRRGPYKPQTYDETWAHKSRSRLDLLRVPLNIAWYAVSVLMRLGGNCFERRLLGDDILGHNLLVIAKL
jgi:SAM-dependent methyltransferase